MQIDSCCLMADNLNPKWNGLDRRWCFRHTEPLTRGGGVLYQVKPSITPRRLSPVGLGSGGARLRDLKNDSTVVATARRAYIAAIVSLCLVLRRQVATALRSCGTRLTPEPATELGWRRLQGNNPCSRRTSRPTPHEVGRFSRTNPLFPTLK
jgi:hypothetical protein